MPINYIRRGHQYGQAQTAIDNALYQMERAFAALPPGVSRNLATEANMLLLTLQKKCRRHVYPKSSELCTWATLAA